jgi:hypothetical protein
MLGYPTSQKKSRQFLQILKKVVRPITYSKRCITLKYNPERLPDLGAALEKSIHPRFLNKKTNRTLRVRLAFHLSYISTR